jgi:hypothetical protein
MTSKASPGFAPTLRMVVPASRATALRLVVWSPTKTNVPAGASTSSPSTVKLARPALTK